MITVRKSEERNHTEKKEQKSWMTFDSENKADVLQKGFGVLKILNEEILSPGSGFILHTKQNLIIITYVLDGVVIYKGPLAEPDFMEAKDFHQVNVSPDTKQYAFNVSQSEDAHIFQCGFAIKEPDSSAPAIPLKEVGIKKLFTHAERQGVLRLIASLDGKDASLPIDQDVQMYSTYIHKGNHVIHELGAGRTSWLHVVKGQIRLNNLYLQTGDGAGFSDERSVSFTAEKPSEILLFDLCGKIPEELKTILTSKSKIADLVEVPA